MGSLEMTLLWYPIKIICLILLCNLSAWGSQRLLTVTSTEIITQVAYVVGDLFLLPHAPENGRIDHSCEISQL